MDAIRTEHLSKRYRDTVAVDDLSFSVGEGELCALLGVNGAGKTTTVKMLSTLTAPDAGDAYLLGKSVTREAAAVREIVAVSPQESAVAPLLSVRENLALICGVHGLSRAESDARIAEAVEKLGLSAVLTRPAGKLSGGWQRRLSIAMALISHPRILFLDEPTLGLDVIARSELWELLRALKGNVTILLTTHYMEEAEALADTVAVMRDGRLIAAAPTPELLRMTGTARLEDAFLALVKGEVR